MNAKINFWHLVIYILFILTTALTFILLCEKRRLKKKTKKQQLPQTMEIEASAEKLTSEKEEQQSEAKKVKRQKLDEYKREKEAQRKASEKVPIKSIRKVHSETTAKQNETTASSKQRRRSSVKFVDEILKTQEQENQRSGESSLPKSKPRTLKEAKANGIILKPMAPPDVPKSAVIPAQHKPIAHSKERERRPTAVTTTKLNAEKVILIKNGKDVNAVGKVLKKTEQSKKSGSSNVKSQPKPLKVDKEHKPKKSGKKSKFLSLFRKKSSSAASKSNTIKPKASSKSQTQKLESVAGIVNESDKSSQAKNSSAKTLVEAKTAKSETKPKKSWLQKLGFKRKDKIKKTSSKSDQKSAGNAKSLSQKSIKPARNDTIDKSMIKAIISKNTEKSKSLSNKSEKVINNNVSRGKSTVNANNLHSQPTQAKDVNKEIIKKATDAAKQKSTSIGTASSSQKLVTQKDSKSVISKSEKSSNIKPSDKKAVKNAKNLHFQPTQTKDVNKEIMKKATDAAKQIPNSIGTASSSQKLVTQKDSKSVISKSEKSSNIKPSNTKAVINAKNLSTKEHTAKSETKSKKWYQKLGIKSKEKTKKIADVASQKCINKTTAPGKLVAQKVDIGKPKNLLTLPTEPKSTKSESKPKSFLQKIGQKFSTKKNKNGKTADMASQKSASNPASLVQKSTTQAAKSNTKTVSKTQTIATSKSAMKPVSNKTVSKHNKK